jgi:hypothetical protein
MPLRRAQARLPFEPSVPGAAYVRETEALAGAVIGIGIDAPKSVIQRADAIARREFTFLRHAETLPEIRWRERHVSHLWSYNLHYFDYARDLAWAFRRSGNEQYRDAFHELALGWVHGTRPGQGDGWEPYAVSLRLVNWIHAYLIFGKALPEAFRGELEASLALQTSWLERRIEYHIQANHLQKNLFALGVAGLFFEGADAARWRRKGLRGTWAAVLEQTLPDGGHFERSPMYHVIALHDFLELIALCEAVGERPPPPVIERVRRMVSALGVLARPDGTLHLFNDAAHGIAPSMAHLDRLALRVLGAGVPDVSGVLSLPDSGYFGVCDPAGGDRLVVDCGEPAPRHQPGHAHCDLLHFELDLAGRPFAVDSGVHGYGGDPYREYVRSTRAHNTVSIGEREQHELWGTFRMARRGRILYARHEGDRRRYRFEGAYSPYHDGQASHHRTIERRDGRWRIVDRVDGARGARLSNFLHLHPRWRLVEEAGRWLARDGEMAVEVLPFGGDHVSLWRGETAPVQGWYCPEFGRALPAPVLETVVESNDARCFGYDIRPYEGYYA